VAKGIGGTDLNADGEITAEEVAVFIQHQLLNRPQPFSK
jgi:hypothetical protein